MCYDGESPNVYEEWCPTARKRHRCYECGGWIEPGEKYQRVRGLWDGDWLTYKTCAECVSIRNHLFGKNEYIFGDLNQCLFEEKSSTHPLILRFLENRERRGGAGKEADHE